MSCPPHCLELISAEKNSSSQTRVLASTKRSRAIGGARSRNRDSQSQSKLLPPPGGGYPLIVHCHLCWDWVWQRPQQFLSRLSRRHSILFIETVGPDPRLASPVARFEPAPEYPNVTRLRLQFPSWRWGQSEYVDRTRRRLVQEGLFGPLAGQFENSVQWFYDPMAVSAFAGHLGEIATVYDCMDEHSQFREAHPDCAAREAELLARADLVFTGGRRLYEAKRKLNANCHFYGCGVDVRHFGRARDVETLVPSELKGLGQRVLGYFGVVDERIDYGLLTRLADAQPHWSIVMIGPVLKVDERTLPQRPNLHWLGQRPYSELPAYAKAFDLCLMPFARNESTEFINPTKALEYMATGRMIVSSSIPDVVSNFGSVVKVARSHEEFIYLCRQALAAPDSAAIANGLRLAAANTWDSIVEKLEAHIDEMLVRKLGRNVRAGGKR